MNVHCSDIKKRMSDILGLGCILVRLLAIDLSRFPKGNVTSKTLRLRHVLKSGSIKEYEYHYHVVNIFGKGQIHLPVKNKKRYQKEHDKRWRLHDEVIYRNEIEARIEETKKRLDRAIRRYNTYKKSTEKPETFESVMMRAEADVKCKCIAEVETARPKWSEYNPGRNPGYDINGLIVTDLGEEVRSKNECIFANKLNEMHIPYIYEMELENIGKPDFTIFLGGRIYFIELLGMLRDNAYKVKAKEKLDKYISANIKPGEMLVYVDVTEGIDTLKIESLLNDLADENIPNQMVHAYDMEKYIKNEERKKADIEYIKNCISF